jgi:hypothetical protein
MAPPAHAAFERCQLPAGPQFLSIREGNFLERTHTGDVISGVPFEYVVPQELSFSTVTALPVVKTERGVFVGLEVRDLPAVQACTGSSRVVTVPSWRIPRSLRSVRELPAFVSTGMRRDFAVAAQNVWELGGPYFSSPGVTPEVVFPFAIEVEANDIASSQLRFMDCAVLGARLDQIQDAHSLIAIWRLRHALGDKVFGVSR